MHAHQLRVMQVVMGPGGTGAVGGVVDGVYSDDVQGFGEEHPDAQGRMNLSDAEVVLIRNATQVGVQVGRYISSPQVSVRTSRHPDTPLLLWPFPGKQEAWTLMLTK